MSESRERKKCRMCPSYNSRAAEFLELLSIQDKSALLQIARQSLTETIVHGRRWQPDIATGLLAERRGAFVTLELRGKLRGCVGQVETQKSLAWTVAHCAVLSQPKSITPNEVEIGRHGLVVERGPFRGLLLPQVAPDRNWTSEQFLSETCLKAGLPGDAWELSETRIFGFTAEVFSETKPAAQSSRSPSLRSSHQ